MKCTSFYSVSPKFRSSSEMSEIAHSDKHVMLGRSYSRYLPIKQFFVSAPLLIMARFLRLDIWGVIRNSRFDASGACPGGFRQYQIVAQARRDQEAGDTRC